MSLIDVIDWCDMRTLRRRMYDHVMRGVDWISYDEYLAVNRKHTDGDSNADSSSVSFPFRHSYRHMNKNIMDLTVSAAYRAR